MSKRAASDKQEAVSAKKVKISSAEQMTEKFEEIDREVETLRGEIKELRENAAIAKDSQAKATQRMRDALKSEMREEVNDFLQRVRESVMEESRKEFNEMFMNKFTEKTPETEKLEEELKEARNRIKALEEKIKVSAVATNAPRPSTSGNTFAARPAAARQGVFNVQVDTKSMFFVKIGVNRDGFAFLTHYTEKEAGEDFYYRFEGEFDFMGSASNVSFNESTMTNFYAALVNSGSVKPNKRAAARDFFSFFKNSDGKYSRYYPIADEEKLMETVTSHFPGFESS